MTVLRNVGHEKLASDLGDGLSHEKAYVAGCVLAGCSETPLAT
ncbi:hypothetical protein C8R31_107108 [Nitrosospira sp. Nsp2]|nr:hypothetical protein C8R31_107108 [Nitrosospira sp. Nsp2]